MKLIRRQLAAVVAAPPLQPPASSPPSPVADLGALPPDLLPHLLLGVISFSVLLPLLFLILDTMMVVEQ